MERQARGDIGGAHSDGEEATFIHRIGACTEGVGGRGGDIIVVEAAGCGGGAGQHGAAYWVEEGEGEGFISLEGAVAQHVHRDLLCCGACGEQERAAGERATREVKPISGIGARTMHSPGDVDGNGGIASPVYGEGEGR